ncbi:chymotrypsin-like elastase family member 2B [Coregonus clupeaformis]|uniref:chymotrypsin-like elastase family member 2B n=1 Tax=Coregonus clupeaformis TaxID=59861 RepID=UPI001E1C37C5|nr:chymotrypsin-like elastase family member 2B [Coregonus clupeaformis]
MIFQRPSRLMVSKAIIRSNKGETATILDRLSFLLLLAAYAYGCGTPTYEPTTNRIVNGEDARTHSWQYQISMPMKHGSRWHHTCGGTLIGSCWVLTARHCIWPGDVYRVVMGEHDQSVQEGIEQIRDVLRILVHPDWDIDMVTAAHGPMTDKLQQACYSCVCNEVKKPTVFTHISGGIADFSAYICGEEHCGGGKDNVNLVVT